MEDLEKEHGFRLTEVQIDGTVLLSHTFQKRGYDLSSRTQITPSPDGRHFASVIVSLWWFWRELDMGRKTSSYIFGSSISQSCLKGQKSLPAKSMNFPFHLTALGLRLKTGTR